MENLKKNPLSLQLNVEDFAPASNDEKKSLVIMRESVNFWKDGMRRLKKNKIAMVSLVVILLIAFMAYILPSLWPYSYEQQIKGSNNLAPFEYSAAEQKLIDQGENVFPHILGTDRMGRDFAVRVMMGTRVSLSVGLLASVLVLLIGATYGAISAFAGGWVDNIMMRITDVLYTIPTSCSLSCWLWPSRNRWKRWRPSPALAGCRPSDPIWCPSSSSSRCCIGSAWRVSSAPKS